MFFDQYFIANPIDYILIHQYKSLLNYALSILKYFQALHHLHHRELIQWQMLLVWDLSAR